MNEDEKELIGPLIVVDSTGRMTTVYNPGTKLQRNFNSFEVKPYYRDINENISSFRSKCDNGSSRPVYSHPNNQEDDECAPYDESSLAKNYSPLSLSGNH